MPAAQFKQLPTVATFDFENAGPSQVAGKQMSADFGREAAKAINAELTKLNLFDVVDVDTVHTTAKSLGLPLPVQGQVSLLRLGQELRASSVTTGQILNYRVISSGSTRRAEVIMRAIVTDVASGLQVNGAAVIGKSTDRIGGDLSEEGLIIEAIGNAAAQIVDRIHSTTLPRATVLNTYENTALINRGTRSGFQNGAQVIILRGRNEVATATVYDVEPDQAYVRIRKQILGIQPGDSVRAIFDVPEIASQFPRDPKAEEPVKKQSRSRGSNTGFIQLLLLTGLLVALLGNGRGSNDNPFTSFDAQAGLFVGNSSASDPGSGTPGVLLTWSTDLFFKSSKQRFQWQFYRVANGITFCQAADSSLSQVVDSSLGQTVNDYYNWSGFPTGGSTCLYPNPTGPGTHTNPDSIGGMSLGTPLTYAVELIYRLNALDLPNPGTSTGDCYFITNRSYSQVATPFAQPTLTSPSPSTTFTVTGLTTFKWNAVQTSVQFNADYCLEISTTSTFDGGTTWVASQIQKNTGGTLSTSVDLSTTNTSSPAFIRSATNLYWRIGARNHQDYPGPVPDASGQRFIFSKYGTLQRPTPPPAPAVKSGPVRPNK